MHSPPLPDHFFLASAARQPRQDPTRAIWKNLAISLSVSLLASRFILLHLLLPDFSFLVSSASFIFAIWVSSFYESGSLLPLFSFFSPDTLPLLSSIFCLPRLLFLPPRQTLVFLSQTVIYMLLLSLALLIYSLPTPYNWWYFNPTGPLPTSPLTEPVNPYQPHLNTLLPLPPSLFPLPSLQSPTILLYSPLLSPEPFPSSPFLSVTQSPFSYLSLYQVLLFFSFLVPSLDLPSFNSPSLSSSLCQLYIFLFIWFKLPYF